MDMPTMVDAFDSMPEAMQSYLIYQFLRRCAKPTLQMVANVVNPALKCDPFNMLPVELGMQIIRLLDAQSMCRAAQVSKRWRKHINSDEKAWKDLLERDGFVLPDGEIARAVKEGWGWQHPGEDGFEEDLSKHVSRATPEPHIPSSPPAVTVISDDDETASSTITSRTKRRSAVAKAVTVNKKLKRRLVQVSASATKPSSVSTSARTTLHREIKAAKGGPNALANVAASAIPNPTTGLDSLRGMHLFKSLYQRHYLIRKSWMQEDSQPQHLAFRAHHRHVVTCLLFDSEKILTGSDDTKINVYDTKTGALKNRLEGHEGGVWALQYEGDTLVSGSTDRSVRVWDIKSGRCLQVFQGHTSTVRCLVILKPVQVDTAPDGSPIMMPKEPLIITGSRDSTLRVWKLPQPGDRQIFHAGPPARDTDNPYFLRTLSGHHNSVRAIAAHGDTLISGSYDCTVRVWKISNGDLVHRLQGHTQKVYSVVLDHARNRCISGSMDNLVKVWDLTSGACLFNLEGHTSLVGLLDLSHDRLVSAAADSTLRIWDPESGTCKATLSAHTGAITCFQHDGQKVISGSDRTLKMWNVRNGECVKDLLTELSGVWQVRFDERRCVAAVQRNNLTYIEVSIDLPSPS
jgi:F-box and WD-40 domain protein CDC4